ncbi:MAG: ECF-type sigma factor [Planctomycetota bacterium]
MAAVPTVLQPLIDEAAASVPGARDRLSAAIAQVLDPVLDREPPAGQVDALRRLLASLRAGVGQHSLPGRSAQPVLLAAADAVRLALAARTPGSTSQREGARLPQTALELLAEGALDQLEHANRIFVEIEREDAPAAQVARLRFYAGLDLPEIAAVLEMSSNNVRRAWNRARARLRG